MSEWVSEYVRVCVRYASAAHLTFYINQIEIWFDIYSVATDVVVCICYVKFEIVAKTNYQTRFNVHARSHTHSNDTLEFTAIQSDGTVQWKHTYIGWKR